MTPTTPSPISDQAAGEPKWRTELRRIADDYQPEGLQAILALEEMRQALRELLESTACDCGVACRDDGDGKCRYSTAPTTGSAPVAWEKRMQEELGHLVIAAREQEKAYLNPGVLYEHLGPEKTEVERAERLIVNLVRSWFAAPASPAACVLTDEHLLNSLRYEFLRDVYTPSNGFDAIDEGLWSGGEEMGSAIDRSLMDFDGWNIDHLGRALLAASTGGEKA